MVGQDCSSRESTESSPAASTTWGGLPGMSGDPDDILRARESACERALGLRMEGAGCRACSFCSPCSPLHPLHPLCHSQPLHPLEPSASFAPHCSSCTLHVPCSPCTTPSQACVLLPLTHLLPRYPAATPEHPRQRGAHSITCRVLGIIRTSCSVSHRPPEGGQGHPLGLLSPNQHQLVQLSTRCGTSARAGLQPPAASAWMFLVARAVRLQGRKLWHEDPMLPPPKKNNTRTRQVGSP